MNARPTRAPNPDPSAPPAPSFVPAAIEPSKEDAGMPAVVPSTSRMAEKVRGLVERHLDQSLSVLRRWMEDKTRSG